MYHLWYYMRMSDKRIRVHFYRNANGNEPVRDWLVGLSRADRLEIGTDIKSVEFGWPIGLPVCRSLGNGIWEVRSTLNNRIARVLFCIEDDVMWLLQGFIKKQQTTPKNEIELARKRRAEIISGLKLIQRKNDHGKR